MKKAIVPVLLAGIAFSGLASCPNNRAASVSERGENLGQFRPGQSRVPALLSVYPSKSEPARIHDPFGEESYVLPPLVYTCGSDFFLRSPVRGSDLGNTLPSRPSQTGRTVPSTNKSGADSETLPEGKGRDLMFEACVQCHDFKVVLSQRKTREAWRRSVNEMIWRGAPLVDNEAAEITSYLGASFGAEKGEKD